jgi:CRISPR system Cascade subunit CasC
MSKFLAIHIIQTLPPSNPNRGSNGDVKSCTFGGVLRSRMSSQSQKRAAREWYAKNSNLDVSQKAQRSRRWADPLAKQLIWAPQHQRESIACLLISLFNSSAEKLFPNALEMKSLLFLAEHEIKKLAMLAEHHSATLCDWADRLESFKVFQANEKKKDKEKNEEDETPMVEAEEVTAQKKKKEKAVFSQHATASEIKPIRVAITKELSSNIPGDIALFGRMMASIVETSVDGSVQVAHAISVNSLPRTKTFDNKWRVGEIDFFSAKDDKLAIEDADSGAAMIGEVSFSAPVYYRYANIAIDNLTELMGDSDLAKDAAAAFVEGFIMALPEGFKNSFAHSSLPEFVMLEVIEGCPYQLSSAFSAPIDRPNLDTPTDHGGVSIGQQAVKVLMNRRAEMHELYGNQSIGMTVTALADHHDGGLTLERAIGQTLSTCF